MNRLASRLVFAMMAVAVVSLVAITVSQIAIVTSEFRRLPPEVRNRVRAFRPGRLPGNFPGNFRPADSEEVVLRGFNSFRDAQARSLVVGLAAAGALSVALAALLSRTIAGPVERVSRAATRVAAGDLTARVALSPSQERSADQLSELARNFNSMAGSLEGLEGERKAMIADIAHELRTPLTALQLRLEAVLEGLVPLDLEEAERLNRQLGLLTRLVEDLRLLSLADAGRLRLLSRTTDLTRLVQEVAEAHRPRASRQGVRISVDAAEALPLQADSDRLTQIITNLLDNALRVTPEGGQIGLRTLQDGDHAWLEVEDDGPGISEAELPRLFNRFQQGRDTSGKSGLGLAIVQTLVRLHDGEITAENRPEGGARFTVRLPIGAVG